MIKTAYYWITCIVSMNTLIIAEPIPYPVETLNGGGIDFSGKYDDSRMLEYAITGEDLAALDVIWVPGVNEINIDIPKLYSSAEICLDELFPEGHDFILGSMHFCNFSYFDTKYYYGITFLFTNVRIKELNEMRTKGIKTRQFRIVIFFDGTYKKPQFTNSEPVERGQ